MKKKTIIAYLLIFALFLSACSYNPFPPATEEPTDGTSPTLESLEYEMPTGTLENMPVATSPAEPIYGDIYTAGPYEFQYVSFYANDHLISGMALCSVWSSVKNAVIPSEVMGLPVVAIGHPNIHDPLFDRFIVRIVLPETVQYIGNYAFYDCANLTEVNLPAQLVYVGTWAFSGCSGPKELCITADLSFSFYAFAGTLDLQNVQIQEGVTEIPSFSGCTKLTSITLPSSTKQLGLYNWDIASPSFSGTSITFLEIPEGVTCLGYYLFEDSNIESIILPSTLEKTGDRAFNCDTLKAVYFRGTEEQFIESLYDEIAATIYFLSETQPTQEGNYWHYVDGKPVIW